MMVYIETSKGRTNEFHKVIGCKINIKRLFIGVLEWLSQLGV